MVSSAIFTTTVVCFHTISDFTISMTLSALVSAVCGEERTAAAKLHLLTLWDMSERHDDL